MKFFTVCALLISFSVNACAQAPDRLDPQNTYVVIVGVLKWQQASLTSYSDDVRQDVALKEQLESIGVPPKNIKVLLDKQATRDAINAAVDTVAKQAATDSTLLVYYAGHGMLQKEEGIFACYDIDTNKMLETGWRHRDLSKSLQSHFKGRNVLLFADCCFSGALQNVAKELGGNGIHATSLTSASAANVSTGNWTFTQSLIAALSGDRIVDADSDGVISIAEAAKDVELAMQYFEKQRFGYSIHVMPPAFQLVKTRPAEFNRGPKAWHGFERGQFVLARRKNAWKMARVIDGRDDNSGSSLLVQFQDYNQRPRIWVAADKVQNARKPTLKAVRPMPLSPQEAKEKANVGGKFTKLLKQIKVEEDFRLYGDFRDFGMWAGTTHAGHKNLPAGHWVYAYPYWHIWQAADAIRPAVPGEVRLEFMADAERPVLINGNDLPAYDAKQMAGKPNTPEPGDHITAWASESEDGTKAWVELDYDQPICPSEVHVYESYNPGAVYQLSGVIDGKETLLWKGADPTKPNELIGVSKIPLNTKGKAISRIRIYLNCKAVPGWNEIDAVGLVDGAKRIHWASDARASTTFGQNNNIRFVDPFQDPKERIAERKREIRAEIQGHKTRVRSYEDAIEVEKNRMNQLFDELNRMEDKKQ